MRPAQPNCIARPAEPSDLLPQDVKAHATDGPVPTILFQHLIRVKCLMRPVKRADSKVDNSSFNLTYFVIWGFDYPIWFVSLI